MARYLADVGDSLCGGVLADLDKGAHLSSDELFAERGLGSDDEDLVFGGADLRATATGGEEVECGGCLRFCGVFEGD